MKKIETHHAPELSAGQSAQQEWWQKEIVYQIYPRSFQDSNGDGIGDLRGIVSRLDYLHALGIRAIWISPIYPSPMADFGYDISDYTGIHPLFGNMNDFDRLITEIHARGMKLILDLVPNHSSDQHPWFVESRSSRTNPRRDWYIWKDPLQDDTPPNNWLSVFGGSAWQWDENTGQYYYHAFLKEQPDLNWRNPAVQQAMLDVMRFWLDKGVDGFRVDVMWHMIKDELLRNNPANPDYQDHMSTFEKLIPSYSTDQPEVHEVVRAMRRLVDEYDSRVLIGEIYLDVHRLVKYYGENNDEAHMPFNFLLMNRAWDPATIAAIVDEYEGAVPEGAWPNWVLGNHDNTRIATRIGKEQARVAGMLLLTLRGTPTIYYGDEIGMTNVPIPADEQVDPQGLNMPDKNLSRDPERTPMQWDDSTNAGFSKVRPWLRVAEDYRKVNVKEQFTDEDSTLNFFRRMIAFRQQEQILLSGEYLPVYTDKSILAYMRQLEEKKILVVLNLSAGAVVFTMPHEHVGGIVLVSTIKSRENSVFRNSIEMQANEGIVIRLEGNTNHVGHSG
jgi:alpha-glucosidase